MIIMIGIKVDCTTFPRLQVEVKFLKISLSYIHIYLATCIS